MTAFASQIVVAFLVPREFEADVDQLLHARRPVPHNLRTTCSSHNPSPAVRVSRTWLSKSSVSDITTAMPPCARLVFDSRWSFW